MWRNQFLSKAGKRLAPGASPELKKRAEAPFTPVIDEKVIPISSARQISSSRSWEELSLDHLLQDYRATIDEVKEYARSFVEGKESEPLLKPIIGEEANILGQVFCIVAGRHYMVRGKSGSGKTAVVDKVVGLLPAKMIYKIGLSSELALYRDLENINNAKILYVTEIQKAYQKSNSPVVELLKDITEGKRSERRRLNTRGKVLMDVVTAGKMAIVTGASENRYMENEDQELKRRLLHFYTDDSPEQIEKINLFYTQLRSPARVLPLYPFQRYELLSAHIQRARIQQFAFEDPFYACVQEIIPSVSKSSSYLEYYYTLINAGAQFHFRDRLVQGKKLYLSLHDHHLAHALFHSPLLQILREFNPNQRDLELIEQSASPPDWEQWWAQGGTVMKEVSTPLYEQWKESHLHGGKSITFAHPVTGKLIEVPHGQEY